MSLKLILLALVTAILSFSDFLLLRAAHISVYSLTVATGLLTIQKIFKGILLAMTGASPVLTSGREHYY